MKTRHDTFSNDTNRTKLSIIFSCDYQNTKVCLFSFHGFCHVHDISNYPTSMTYLFNFHSMLDMNSNKSKSIEQRNTAQLKYMLAMKHFKETNNTQYAATSRKVEFTCWGIEIWKTNLICYIIHANISAPSPG